MTVHIKNFILVFLSLCPALALAFESLSYQSYNDGMLRMNLITPSTHGRVFLKQGEVLELLDGAVLESLFTLRIKILCERLVHPSELYWSLPDRAPLKSDIPAQPCVPHLITQLPTLPPVKLFKKGGACMLDTAGNTLWHTARELSKRNKKTIYQNIYALFVTNRMAFDQENIHRIRSRILYCPENALFNHIEASHARKLFGETLQGSKRP